MSKLKKTPKTTLELYEEAIRSVIESIYQEDADVLTMTQTLKLLEEARTSCNEFEYSQSLRKE